MNEKVKVFYLPAAVTSPSRDGKRQAGGISLSAIAMKFKTVPRDACTLSSHFALTLAHTHTELNAQTYSQNARANGKRNIHIALL